MWKETKRTEELEEAGYRSPTWAVLRALQQINRASRIEGDAAMSTPPFFQSAGRGDLLFWRGKEGPTEVIWERLSEQEKEMAGRVEHDARLGRVVLDQEIPPGGFVRIHDSSQVWESEWKKRESSRQKV